MMALVTLGGLGPAVVAAAFHRSSLSTAPETTWGRWSLHVRVVLTMSVTLFFMGFIVFYFFEFNQTLSELSFSEKLVAAAFQSVSFRTAGFNTVDLSQLNRVTLVVVLMLMTVGGSPGSTAGGVKTSTIAVVLLGVKAMLLGREEVEVGGRTIAKEVVYKAISILAFFVALLLLGFLLLLLTETDQEFEVLLFETVSAVATVGVSMGVTQELSGLGKIIVTFLMFAGRIGPLTMALAIQKRPDQVALRYPEGDIMIG
jgi:trk system potassium uptake protein TrkH